MVNIVMLKFKASGYDLDREFYLTQIHFYDNSFGSCLIPKINLYILLFNNIYTNHFNNLIKIKIANSMYD